MRYAIAWPLWKYGKCSNNSNRHVIQILEQVVLQ